MYWEMLTPTQASEQCKYKCVGKVLAGRQLTIEQCNYKCFGKVLTPSWASEQGNCKCLRRCLFLVGQVNSVIK